MEKCRIGEAKGRGWSRRRVLQSGLGVAASLGIAPAPGRCDTPLRARANRLVVVWLTGGASQLETWDPKPDAPARVRGPFGAIDTPVPGMRIGALLPRTARQARHFALIRTLHHGLPALHAVGRSLLLTGRPDCDCAGERSIGAVLAAARAANAGVRAHAVLTADDAGALGPDSRVADRLRGAAAERPLDRYGRSPLGRSLLAARILLESGTRSVTVSQFDGIYHRHSWDTHGYPDLPTRVRDLADHVAPEFDQAFAAFLADLHDRGLLDETLVLCAGEFGRSPEMTGSGGRDHWTRCWSVLLAGGGIPGGQVIGQSDAYAAEPAERPVATEALHATMLRTLGLPHAAGWLPELAG